MNVLLVEDDFLIGHGLRAGLADLGYPTEWVRDGAAADRALQAHDYGMVVLDLQLPRVSGLEVLARLRGRGISVPVLILSALGQTSDRVRGLDGGADDYLVKPFDLRELHARLKALERRAGGSTSAVLCCGPLVLDPRSYTVSFEDQPVALSRLEFTLLRTLMERAGEVVTRHRLEQVLHGWKDEVESNTLEVYVHRLRKRLRPEIIRTVRGVGYLMQCS
jgi:DNA-binding response OmpR family regulator